MPRGEARLDELRQELRGEASLGELRQVPRGEARLGELSLELRARQPIDMKHNTKVGAIRSHELLWQPKMRWTGAAGLACTTFA